MKTETPITITVSHRYQASAERVFDAWLDAPRTAQFLFASTGGKTVRAEVDARVGGKFIFTERRDGEDVEHTGEYLEIDRPRRLRFSFAASGSEATPVQIDIVPLESGCELTLTHRMPAEYADWTERTTNGWFTILGNLAKMLGE